MDADRFDDLLRSLSSVGSRRRALVSALAGTIGWGLLDPNVTDAHDLSAKCKKKSGKQKKKCLKKAKKHNASHSTETGGGAVLGGGGGTGGGGDTDQCVGVDLQTDVNNCGSCGFECDLPNATPRCVSGTCEVNQCDPGFEDRDPNAAGCETQLGTVEH